MTFLSPKFRARAVDFVLYAILTILILALFGLATGWAHATTITGVIKQSGQLFNGYTDISLVYPGVSSSGGSHLNLPGADPYGHLPVVNGQYPHLTLDGNDTILPSGTFYQVTLYDRFNAPLARMNYVITGATFDIGAAIPTPVTTANISFLDLLGIRNFSAAHAAFGALTFGTMTVGTGGIAGAPQIEGVVNADAEVLLHPTSTTCGLAEALTDLPATGGTVQLQRGLCTATSTITINKPVTFIGHGYGGTPPQSGALLAPTILANGSSSASLFLIQSGTSPLAGITFRDIAILGNLGVGGATGGDCIQIQGQGPSLPIISGVTLDRVYIFGCKGHGLHISDAVSGTIVRDSVLAGSGGSGIYLETPTAGPLTDVTIAASRIDANGADGITVAGAQVGRVRITASSLINSTVNGANVSASSTASTFTAYQSTFGNNGNAGVLVAAGYGHVIEASAFPPGTHQQYGVYANLPTLSDTFTTQLTLKDNDLQGALTDDLYEGASTSYLLLYPQSEQQGSTNVHYSLLNPAAVHTVVPAGAGTITDLTGTNLCTVTYQNLTGFTVSESITHQVSGSSGATMTATVGPSSPSITVGLWSAVAAFSSAASAMGTFLVPNGFFYSVTRDNLSSNCGIIHWVQTTIP